jgi:hypothetical protein
MPDPKLILIGIPWCREEDYGAYVALLEDANLLAPAWHDYAALLEEVEHDYQERGQFVRRVYIDPRTFAMWCERRGSRINTNAAHNFAAETVKEHRKAGGAQ